MAQVLKYGSKVALINGGLLKVSQATNDIALYLQNQITSAIIPSASFIASAAFQNKTTLTKVIANNCSIIYSSGLRGCTALQIASFPKCKTIGGDCFYGCSSLSSIDLPECSFVPAYAFANCTSLTNISLPNCSYISYCAFYNCTKLTELSLPKCTKLSERALQSQWNLSYLDLPECTYIAESAASYQGQMSYLNLPKCTNIAHDAFTRGVNLQTVTVGGSCYFAKTAFYSCFNLKSLYLTNMSKLCSLYPTAFESTPIAGYSASAGCYGSIYVYPWLLSSYKTTGNWSAFSERFTVIPPPTNQQYFVNTVQSGIVKLDNMSNPIYIQNGSTISAHYAHNNGVSYSSVTVLNASYSWDESTETLTISNPTDVVYVEVIGDMPDGGNTFETAPEINYCGDYKALVDGNGYVYSNQKYTLFKIVPLESGTYTFKSDGSVYNIYGCLFDANGSKIVQNVYFETTQALVAGTTYYFGAAFWSSSNTGTIPFTISKS